MQVSEWMETVGASKKVFELFDRQPKMALTYNDAGEKELVPKGDIEFRSVSFTYPSRPSVKVLKVKKYAVSLDH